MLCCRRLTRRLCLRFGTETVLEIGGYPEPAEAAALAGDQGSARAASGVGPKKVSERK